MNVCELYFTHFYLYRYKTNRIDRKISTNTYYEDPISYEDALDIDHRLNMLIDIISDITGMVLDVYKETDGVETKYGIVFEYYTNDNTFHKEGKFSTNDFSSLRNYIIKFINLYTNLFIEERNKYAKHASE